MGLNMFTWVFLMAVSTGLVDITRATISNKAGNAWREDGRCGKQFPLTNGYPSQCNPSSPDHCCSSNGWCGRTDAHCKCSTCLDYSLDAQAARSCTNQQDCRASFLKIPYPGGGEWTAGYKKSGEKEWEFASATYGTKGCYGYTSGTYAGHYFFGSGGSDTEMTTPLPASKGAIRTECNGGWGSTTDWSKWQNVEDENILCKDSDQSYIVQAITRWNNDADDNRQFRWVCSPPDNNVITGNCRYHSDWSNSAEGDGEQKCNKEEAMVGIKKTYFDSAGDDDWKYKIRCCKLDTYTLSEKPNSCKWGDWTSDTDPSDNYVSGQDYNHDELSPPYWDENVYMTGMKTKYKEWGTTQNRMLRFRTCEFGCKVTNIEIIEKPKFVDKGWEVIGRHALFDCESNSIDLGMANEESVEESVGLEVSQEYSNEVNGAVTVGHSVEISASPLGIGGKAENSVEMSVGYSHTWTNGKTESTEKTTGSALSTSLDKSIESENGLAAWVLMYTKKIEYDKQNVRAIYTKQCGPKIVKEEGTLSIQAQKFTNFQMDIKRYDFDTRRECRQKRKDIGRSKFEQTLLKTWGLEAQKDDSQLESTFWKSLQYDMLPCGKPVKSFIQHFFSDIDHQTRCLFDGVQYKDIENMDECQEACSLHGLNMVAYLPNQSNTPASSLSANPNFRPELEELKDSNGRYTKYPGCFLRKDQRGPSHPDFLGDRCIWNGNLQATTDSTTNAWQQTYWPVDPHSDFYPLCMSACPTTTT